MEFLKKWYEAELTTHRDSEPALYQIGKERGMEFLKKMSDYDISAVRGWFKLEDLTLDLNTGKGSIRITQSFIGETYGQSNRPVCDFLTGFFVGVLEVVTGKMLTGEEITCIAKGDPVCMFKFEPIEER